MADRDVGWLAGSASLAATQMSAGTFVGAVGIHYAVGVSFALSWVGIWAGWLVSILYVAPQLRRFGGVTLPQYLAARYDDDGAGGDRVRALSAVLIAVIYLVFTSAQYVAGGVIVQRALGVPSVYGMVGLAALALAYTAVGGMRASVATDVLLAVVMIAGLVVATGIGLLKVGGLVALGAEVARVDPSLLGLNMPITDLAGFVLAFGLSVAVAPYEVGRVFAMENKDTVRTAIKGSVLIQVLVAVCVTLLGLVARVMFPNLATPDAAVVELVVALFGPIVGGLLLLAVLAAVLSTVDSVLLVSASAVAYDLYADVLADRSAETDPDPQPSTAPTRDPDTTDPTVPSETTGETRGNWIDLTPIRGDGDKRDTLLVARLATVAAAIVPLWLAVNSGLLGGLIQLIVALYASLIAGTLLAPVVLGLHWDGATTAGGAAGVVVGCVGVVVWHLLGPVTGTLPAGAAAVPSVVAGIIASTAAVVGVSLAE